VFRKLLSLSQLTSPKFYNKISILRLLLTVAIFMHNVVRNLRHKTESDCFYYVYWEWLIKNENLNYSTTKSWRSPDQICVRHPLFADPLRLTKQRIMRYLQISKHAKHCRNQASIIQLLWTRHHWTQETEWYNHMHIPQQLYFLLPMDNEYWESRSVWPIGPKCHDHGSTKLTVLLSM